MLSSSLLDYYRTIANERERANEYGRSPDAWKRGMKKSCILEGIVGEYGASAYLTMHGIKHDWSPKRMAGGDGGADIVCHGKRIQVKSGVRWIRRVDSRKRLVPLDCDVYVFATVQPKFSYVDLDGWLFREALIRLGSQRPQGHYNIECDPLDFEPMPRLLKYLAAL